MGHGSDPYRILVIDDDYDLAEQVSLKLKEVGFITEIETDPLKTLDIPRFEFRNKEIKVTLEGQEIKSRIAEKKNRLQIEMDPVLMLQGQVMTISVR